MSKKESVLIRINNITDYHEALQLPKPQHPLFSITDFSKTNIHILRSRRPFSSIYTAFLSKKMRNAYCDMGHINMTSGKA
ncbi:hypothetical protein KUH03_40550 [Sphingobacterium sp. E70]|uniref:hypothetical protein n=1 Tax=Sphingobacterium sp. E70 TaxID=2853439 RepID=UPI00211B91A7|nr:hypothetical protein [Sphingobacterium sp. E70]ULT25080.1 hypothetical protein KUH03_40550 [Sphingobacterium sp. E70]